MDSVQDIEFARAQRVASDTLRQDDIAWLRDAFIAYLASDGEVSLERCLRLPTNVRSMKRAKRDHWLRTAWRQLGPDLSAWQRSESLAAEVSRFRMETWPDWADLGRAPAQASVLDRVLFEAFRLNERVPTTVMQLHNIAATATATATATLPERPAVQA